MAGYRKIILNGESGEVWKNQTDRPHYQFFANWANTCGVCAQYDHAISASSWPIPLHHGCRCRQEVVKAGAQAEPWVDYRAILDELDPAQQTACVGASNYRLITSGVVDWDDVVTKHRVRDLNEVVAIKGLGVDAMVKAGVRRSIAERAHQSVDTDVHKLVERKRAQLVANLNAAGLSNDQIRSIASTGVAARVVAAGPSGMQRLRSADQTEAQLVRSFISVWINQRPIPPQPTPDEEEKPKRTPERSGPRDGRRRGDEEEEDEPRWGGDPWIDD